MEYTIDNSQTVRAYLPDGTVLEAWAANGWLQIAIHPDGPLGHQRMDAEESISRDAFAATFNQVQLHVQAAGQVALPLDIVDMLTRQHAPAEALA